MIKSFKYIVITILIAFFVISIFANYVFTRYIGFNSIELIIIPILLFYSKYIRNIKFTDIFICLAIILGLWCLSVFFLPTELNDTLYNTIRSYLLFFFVFFIIYRNPIFNFKYIYIIALLSKVGDILTSILLLQMTPDDDVIVGANFLTTPIILAYAYKKKSMIHFISVMLLCVVSSFLSITRGILLYTIIDVIIIIVLNIYSIKQFIKWIIVICMISPMVYTVYLAAEMPIKEYSPSFHYRMYRKVLDKDDKDVVTGDNDRKEHYLYVLLNPEEALTPHGLPSRFAWSDFYKTNHRLLYACQDSAIVELIYTFGFFLIPILLSFIRLILFFVKRRKNNVESFIILSCLLNILIALPMGYGLIINPSIIATLAVQLAIAYKMKKYNMMLHRKNENFIAI